MQVQKNNQFGDYNDMSPSQNTVASTGLNAPPCNIVFGTPPTVTVGAMRDYKTGFINPRPQVSSLVLKHYQKHFFLYFL